MPSDVTDAVTTELDDLTRRARDESRQAVVLTTARLQPYDEQLRTALHDALCAGGEEQYAVHVTHHDVVDRLIPAVTAYLDRCLYEAGHGAGQRHRELEGERDRARDVAVALEQELAATAALGRSMTRTVAEQAEQLARFQAGVQTPTVFLDDGLVVIQWPNGPGNVLVSPDVVEAWADAMNGRLIRLERLRDAAATALLLLRADDHEAGTAAAALEQQLAACDDGNVPVSERSDGWHTFTDLYAHRRALTAALAAVLPGLAWRSRLHHDGSMFDGMFIVGAELPGVGQVSYHYHLEHWDDFAHVREIDRAPDFDGHTPGEVVTRLLTWAAGARDVGE